MARRVKGLDRVLRNLNKEVRKIKGASEAGLRTAAEMIRTDSVINTPVRTGVLKGSAKTTSEMTARGPIAAVSYSTDYAVPVHENLEANHRVGTAKFLEKAVVKNQSAVVGTIAASVRIGA